MCQHENQELRYKIDSTNRRYYYYQCIDCGDRVGNMVKREKAVGIELPFDEQAYLNCRNSKIVIDNTERDRRIAELQTEWEEKKKAYKRYLDSPEWRVKAEKVLARDKYLCQSCLERTATQVHHLTYRHIFNEPLFDLVSVCGACHKSITEMNNTKSN